MEIGTEVCQRATSVLPDTLQPNQARVKNATTRHVQWASSVVHAQARKMHTVCHAAASLLTRSTMALAIHTRQTHALGPASPDFIGLVILAWLAQPSAVGQGDIGKPVLKPEMLSVFRVQLSSRRIRVGARGECPLTVTTVSGDVIKGTFSMQAESQFAMLRHLDLTLTKKSRLHTVH